MIDKLNQHLQFHQQALGLRAERTEILSSNIANADTPNYKARDIDFKRALSDATGGAGSTFTTSLARTSASHIAGSASTASGDAALLYRVPMQASIDGNTVESDVERVNFAENALHYQSNLTVLTSKIKTMLAAINAQG